MLDKLSLRPFIARRILATGAPAARPQLTPAGEAARLFGTLPYPEAPELFYLAKPDDEHRMTWTSEIRTDKNKSFWSSPSASIALMTLSSLSSLKSGMGFRAMQEVGGAAFLALGIISLAISMRQNLGQFIRSPKGKIELSRLFSLVGCPLLSSLFCFEAGRSPDSSLPYFICIVSGAISLSANIAAVLTAHGQNKTL